MSEYQYYEFQAVDRPIDAAGRAELRTISSRARITATSLTNSYEWGDFKGDPAKLMERWFDLHLYLSNWGTRRLMVRLPKRLLQDQDLAPFLDGTDEVIVQDAGDNLVLDISRQEVDHEYWQEDEGLLATLAPLRADLLAGGSRLFYLLWLMGVETDSVEPDTPEPLPGPRQKPSRPGNAASAATPYPAAATASGARSNPKSTAATPVLTTRPSRCWKTSAASRRRTPPSRTSAAA